MTNEPFLKAIKTAIDALDTTLETIVTRTYTVGLVFQGATRTEQRKNEKKANEIVRGLQQLINDKITAEKMDQTLELIRQEPTWQGTTGAAKIAAYFNDRSNIGQVAYLTMLNAAKGTIDKERKISCFINKLSEEPLSAVEWLVFGRSPYLEWFLQYQLQIAYDYSRNLVHSARRTVDSHLPEEF